MKFLLLLLLFISSQLLIAESYEIRAVNAGNGVISVQMRETTGNAPLSGDFLVDLVFGLKWDPAYDVDLSALINTSYNIKKSDVRKLKNGFHYQAFYASNLPFAIPEDWNADWIEIMEIGNTLDGSELTGDFYICEVGFDVTTDPDININLTAYYLPDINGFAAGVTLPITLTSFTVEKENNRGLLNWTTSSEMNSNYFLIERSSDAQYWESLGKVQAAGTSSLQQTYTLVDENPTGIKDFNRLIYYRLKSVDRDGKFEFSTLRSLNFSSKGDPVVRLYPNPTHDYLFLERSIQSDGDIKIYSTSGKSLWTQQTKKSFDKVKIDISSLPNGVYWLADGNNQMIQFIKQE